MVKKPGTPSLSGAPERRMNTRTPDAPAASAGRQAGNARACCEPLIVL